jgi:hypothetical protein
LFNGSRCEEHGHSCSNHARWVENDRKLLVLLAQKMAGTNKRKSQNVRSRFGAICWMRGFKLSWSVDARVKLAGMQIFGWGEVLRCWELASGYLI